MQLITEVQGAYFQVLLLFSQDFQNWNFRLSFTNSSLNKYIILKFKHAQLTGMKSMGCLMYKENALDTIYMKVAAQKYQLSGRIILWLVEISSKSSELLTFLGSYSFPASLQHLLSPRNISLDYIIIFWLAFALYQHFPFTHSVTIWSCSVGWCPFVYYLQTCIRLLMRTICTIITLTEKMELKKKRILVLFCLSKTDNIWLIKAENYRPFNLPSPHFIWCIFVSICMPPPIQFFPWNIF
jgi:hypothetical protein